jgi:hypothetical protein
MHDRRRTGVGRLSVAVIALAIVVSGGMIWSASNAAFTATTSNGTNSWTSGTVVLNSDDSGTAMFNATGLKPGSTATKCIAVTYTGNLASSVKLYPASYTGTLGTYLDLTVEQGTGGGFAGCGGFSGTTIYSGTLANIVSNSTGFTTGVGNWTPSANPTTQVYRFTYTLEDNNAAKNLTSTCAFTWEDQNT